MVRVAIALLLLTVLPVAAYAEKRIAFVVGIDKYDNLGLQQQLERAVSDARSVQTALLSLGFEVIAGENLNRAAFNAHWQKFLDKINPGDTAAVYFSGHGVEIEGLNFLLPRDVPNISYGRQEQLKRESLSVSEFLLDLRKRKPQVTLLILDACRDHPLIPPEQKSLGWGGGLARMDAPTGTFIMYSAGAGETALDRLPKDDPDKANSVYTRRLLPLMQTPGLPVHELARQLRLEVRDLNVLEWVEDCWHGNYQGALTDGSAWTTGECKTRVLRGGSWFNVPGRLRSAMRGRKSQDVRDYVFGFRLARTLGP